MKNYNLEQEKLFNKWKNDSTHKEKIFIEDGIIDYDNWKDESLKILFLAKEAYTYDDYGFDLSLKIKDEGPFNNWYNVARWTYAIKESKRNPTNIPDYPSHLDDWTNSNEVLRKIAFVNIKKSSGISQSNWEEIKEYAIKDRKYLSNQIDLINPNIVICNYTFWSGYVNIYDEKEISPIGNSGLVFKHKDRTVVDFWHFANRYPNEMNYYTLCAIIHQSKVFQENK